MTEPVRAHDASLSYVAHDGRLHLHFCDDSASVWLTQAELASVCETTTQNISQIIRGVYDRGVLCPRATCGHLVRVQVEGGRRVRRRLKCYSMDMVLAVVERVQSPRGIEFHGWVRRTLAARLRERNAT